MDLWFDSLKKPVRLQGRAVNLLPMIREIISTWPFEERPEDHSDPVITVWQHDGGVARTSPWLSEAKTYSDPVNAICDFVIDLTHAYNEAHPETLCLHCAASIIDDKLVIFPNGYNQGKSTLMALLASQHIRILCDDVMPLDLSAFTGRSLGIQPRLRNPLPSGLGDHFDAFVGNHKGPDSERFQFLKLGTDYLADFGETYPIGGVVILERNEDGENDITPASQADTLKALIERNFADALPAADTLAGLSALTKQATTCRLNYSDGDAAYDLLMDTFS